MSQFKRWLRMERGSEIHRCKSSNRFLAEITVLILRWSTAFKMHTLKKLCIWTPHNHSYRKTCTTITSSYPYLAQQDTKKKEKESATANITSENKQTALVWSWYTTHSWGCYHARIQGLWGRHWVLTESPGPFTQCDKILQREVRSEQACIAFHFHIEAPFVLPCGKTEMFQLQLLRTSKEIGPTATRGTWMPLSLAGVQLMWRILDSSCT